ncbi:Rieske (2Fe-2S) protein [Coralloluteibacterium thermophilus]|uniref:Rieske (2Fe-2S) protein n=1 Tax=Coralloluteibacterium thermophilum TaxID=2707049 RepID=A0ABV9NQV2_9GAMM
MTPLIEAAAVGEDAYSHAEATVAGEPASLVLIRVEGQVRAWHNVCPHAGRRLDWAPGRFLVDKAGHLVCAAHGASFRRADGLCVAGPCKGQSLVAVAVEERDGQVWLAD